MARKPYAWRYVTLVGGGTGKWPGRSGYFIQWRDPTTGKYCRRSYPTKAIAEAARRFVEADINRWLPQADHRARPWTDTVREFIAGHFADKSPAHRTAARTILEQFRVAVNATVLGDFTAAGVERYLGTRQERPAATRGRDLRYLRLFGNWAKRLGYMPENPATQVKSPRQPKRLKRLPTETEWLQLLWAIPETELDDRQGWYVLILLAITTGLRVDTLLSVGRSHFTLGTPETKGAGLLTVVEPKTDAEDIYGLPLPVAECVGIRFQFLSPGASKLFRWQWFPRKGWERLRAKANLESLRFHDLRGVAGLRAAVAAAQRAGGQALRHTATSTYTTHYADRLQIELAAAQSITLPPLPDLPAFQINKLPRGAGTRVWPDFR